MNKGEIIERCKGKNILVIGDFILDEYVYTNFNRISPEVPVPILTIKEKEYRLGGAANVVNNVAALLSEDSKCFFISVLHEKYKKDVVDILKEKNNIVYNFSYTTNLFENSVKTRIVSAEQNGQHHLRIDKDPENYIPLDVEIFVKNTISNIIDENHIDIIIISDYNKKSLTDYLIKFIISMGKKYEIPIIVDTKSKDINKFKYVDIITPNEKEFEQLTNVNPRNVSFEELELTALNIIKKLKLKYLVLTRSELGITVFSEKESFHFDTEDQRVYDVVGAGDTVLASIALMLSGGFNIKDIISFANKAASVVIKKPGTSTCTLDEIFTNNNKILSREKLISEIEYLKSKNETIVFTNGCFDLLHTGHIKLLKRAKSEGDKLVVGINSDESVKRLKGEKRPCLTQDERSEIIASLEYVDYVVIFDEDTPQELIEAIVPDVLVKGADYKKEDIVGYDVVTKNGGKVITVEQENGKSTTNIIEKIKSNYS